VKRLVKLGVVLGICACGAKQVVSVPDAAPAPPTPMVDASPPPVDPPVVDAGPTARPLPERERLRAIFQKTPAQGFVAMTNGKDRVAVGLPNDDRGFQHPVLVASFTKLWVAVATLRLVGRKLFSLDDEIGALLPELKAKPWADSTVRELMSHLSRVPEFESGFFNRTDIDFSHAAATLAKEVPATTEKRGVWKYRNSEYAILGAVLEAKGGKPAAKVLAEEVFGPAHMTMAGILVGKAPDDVDMAPMGRVRPQNFFTAGNGIATADDLLSFFEAMMNGALIDADAQKTLFAGMPSHDQAALGCWAYPYDKGEGGQKTLLVERPGSFGNVKLVSAFFPEERRAIVSWSGASLDVGKPRTKNSIAWKMAHLALE
jgi:CubicO group peptidase (beta-lactamase class C family)